VSEQGKAVPETGLSIQSGDPCPFCPGRFNEDLICDTCWTYVPIGQTVERSKYSELFEVMGTPASFAPVFSIDEVAHGYCDLPASHPARSVKTTYPLQRWPLLNTLWRIDHG
jgi:hypothetical protein